MTRTFGAVGTLRAGLVGLLAISLLGLAGPAWAHDPEDGHDEDAKHAATDLAGVSMAKIEKDSKANARKRAAAKVPSDPASRAKAARRSAAAVGPAAAKLARTQAKGSAATSAAAAAAADPGQSGSWTAPVATQVLPVFQAVLPNGKVLIWDSVGDSATENYTNHTFTRALVWNAADDSFRRVDVQGYNIFCAGYAQLPDGNVLVVGGNKNAALDGIRQTHLFNWRTETWTRGPDMAAERWYPSVAALANGEAVIVAGGSDRAEVYQTDGQLRTLTGFRSYGDRIYPFLVPRNDGRVELVGPGTQLGTMNTDGAGSLDATRARDGINRDYGSFATFLPGRTLVTGGGSVTEDGQTQVPTRTSVIVNTTAAATSTAPAASMNFPRRQHNLTVLADGSVLATGGQRKSVDGLVDLANPVLAAERWNPATNTWTTLAAAAKIREYHSTAALLPDGRVLTGGGGICGTCVSQGYLEKNLETFTPPYLYRQDGSGELATRPTITGVPAAATVGTTFTASSPVAGTIAKIGLVRLGAPTHSVDQGQRYVPLTFAANGPSLSIDAPADTKLAPPGYYMLFATDTQGVPSVASMVQITPKPTPPAPTNLALNRPATASSTEVAQFPASAANDGNPTTRWSSGYSDNQWWQVDLGAVKDVDTVVTTWEVAYAKRFSVQTSLDGSTFTTAATVDATAAGTQRTTFSNRAARYIRIQGITRGTTYGYSIFETQVFGSGNPPVNTAPTAAAGPDQTVTAGAGVTLNGSASTDPEGTPLTYRWTQTSGTPVTLSSATTARPTFTAPSTAGTIGFSLIVNDGTSDSVPDAVSITVRANAAPTAAAGPDQTVTAGAGVTLNGSASTDPEGTPLTYRWTQTSGTPVTLSSATTARPTFTAPSTAGTLGFSLIVNDGTSDSSADGVVVTVNLPPTGPVNLALNRPATQSSTYGSYGPGRAVDGNTNGSMTQGSVTHTDANPRSWWQVDLGTSQAPDQIVVWNRTDCCSTRLSDYWVFVSDAPFNTTLTPAQQAARPGVWSKRQTSTPRPSATIAVPAGTKGRYVMIQQNTTYTYLSLAEVRVMDNP